MLDSFVYVSFWTYSRVSAHITGIEAIEVEPFEGPVISIAQLGPVETPLLAGQTGVVEILRAWVALVGTPPLDIIRSSVIDPSRTDDGHPMYG